jgi:hypothetical protein
MKTKLVLSLIALSVLTFSCGDKEDGKACPVASPVVCASPAPVIPSCPPDKVCISKKCIIWTKLKGCVIESDKGPVENVEVETE